MMTAVFSEVQERRSCSSTEDLAEAYDTWKSLDVLRKAVIGVSINAWYVCKGHDGGIRSHPQTSLCDW